MEKDDALMKTAPHMLDVHHVRVSCVHGQTVRDVNVVCCGDQATVSSCRGGYSGGIRGVFGGYSLCIWGYSGVFLTSGSLRFPSEARNQLLVL